MVLNDIEMARIARMSKMLHETCNVGCATYYVSHALLCMSGEIMRCPNTSETTQQEMSFNTLMYAS